MSRKKTFRKKDFQKNKHIQDNNKAKTQRNYSFGFIIGEYF